MRRRSHHLGIESARARTRPAARRRTLRTWSGLLLVVLVAVAVLAVGSPTRPPSSTIAAQAASFDQTDATTSTCGPLQRLLGGCRTTTTTTSPGSPGSSTTTPPSPASTNGAPPSPTPTTVATNSAGPGRTTTSTAQAQAQAQGTTSSTAAAGPDSQRSCSHSSPPVPAPTGRWSCTLDDEFNGSALDTTKWTPQLTENSGYTTGSTHPCYVDNPQTVSESGGTLDISVIRLPRTTSCKGLPVFGATRYEAGMVTSYKLFSQRYGYFAVRAQTPSTTLRGLQETLWLYPSDLTLYGGWPNSGEIDFAEFYSALAAKDYPVVHFPGAAHDPNSNVLPNGCSAGDATPGGGFNTYAVMWTPTTITTYFNGVPCFTDTYGSHVTRPDTPPEPFNQPFFLNFTAALGTNVNAVTQKTPMPATTKIDWVRVWQYG